MFMNDLRKLKSTFRYTALATILTTGLVANVNAQAMNPDTEVTEVMMDAHYSGAGFMFTLMGWDPSEPTIDFNTAIDPIGKSYSMQTVAGETYFGQQLTMSINGSWNSGTHQWESTMEANLGGFEFGADGIGKYHSVGPDAWDGEFDWAGRTNEDIVWHTHKWDEIRTIAGVEHSYHVVFELGKFSSTTTTTFYDLKQGGAWKVFGLAAKPDGVGQAFIDFKGNTDWNTSSITYAVVPEPATIAAFGIGAVGLLRARRRK